MLPDFPYGHEIRDPMKKGEAPEKIFEDYDAFRAKMDAERDVAVAARLDGKVAVRKLFPGKTRQQETPEELY